MNVVLISLPWALSTQPSAALGALAAYLKREEPSYSVTTRHEYLRVGAMISFRLYDGLAFFKHDLGEMLYAPLLYPEKRGSVRDYFVEWAGEKLKGVPLEKLGLRSMADLFDHVQRGLAAHLDELVESLGDADVVGLTTCYGQLFPNLAFAQRLAARRPGLPVILGGSTVSARVGPSILREYPFVDYIVQGEGELPLLALLRALDRKETSDTSLDAIPGLVTRTNMDALPNGAALSEVPRMGALPSPDFDEYVALAKQCSLDWVLPLEGSRGCWWDRTKRRDNPKATCYFCNLNVQWGGYRERTTDEVVSEIDRLTERYANTSVFFLDNILRHDGIAEFAQRIGALGKDLFLFYEMRANVTAYELLLLWEAGLRHTQVGIEGLSTSYLKRFGKGTTTIQNLAVMKTCQELGIKNSSNLIINFPQSTAAEVAETVRNIQSFALPYEPCHVSRFTLTLDSTVDKLRAQFGVREVRNRDSFRTGLPDEVWRRLNLFDLSYDGTHADWSSVAAAVDEWIARHEASDKPLLEYQDGGSFLRILDRRVPQQLRAPVLRGAAREIYLHCTEVRTLDRILARFAHGKEAQRAKLRAFLDKMTAERLMFEENGRYLSLATAPTPQAAARRIRAVHAEDARADAAASHATRRLPIADAPAPC